MDWTFVTNGICPIHYFRCPYIENNQIYTNEMTLTHSYAMTCLWCVMILWNMRTYIYIYILVRSLECAKNSYFGSSIPKTLLIWFIRVAQVIPNSCDVPVVLNLVCVICSQIRQNNYIIHIYINTPMDMPRNMGVQIFQVYLHSLGNWGPSKNKGDFLTAKGQLPLT